MRGSIETFGGALLADAVGLGKTYVALALAGTYRSAAAVIPASIRAQWRRACTRVGVDLDLASHESLSRGNRPHAADLLIVDEAHRFRNPATRRYDVLARSIGSADLLLMSATPVVNGARDLVSLLRLFAPDHLFATLGADSLEQAMADGAHGNLAMATAPTVVARSAAILPRVATLLPTVRHRSVVRRAPVDNDKLLRMLRTIDRLQFPTVGGDKGRALMRLHILHRLASSAAACRQTSRGHLAYVDRALQAAESGRPLTRSAARRIFTADDELQLDLGDVLPSGIVPQSITESLRRERARLTLLHGMTAVSGTGPKSRALIRLLRERGDRKTIVFTSAVATAQELARALHWRRVAVVGSGKAWIASGALAVDDVLSLFAPRARAAEQPSAACFIATLIATDLASEGLDLQDADAVVHYDLPWTPLQLEQRVGRVARLGSAHDTAEVVWFAPTGVMEDRLRLESRIAGKAIRQFSLGVATTSLVGRSQAVNRLLYHRECLGRRGTSTVAATPAYAVVRGPLAAAIAVRWSLSEAGDVPELIVIQGDPPTQERDYALMQSLLKRLLNGRGVLTDPPQGVVAYFLSIVRQRLGTSNYGAADAASRRLAGRVVHRARAVAPSRAATELEVLNAVLDRVISGLAVGAQRNLEDALVGGASARALQQWLGSVPNSRLRKDFGVQVVAALFGDGSES